MTEEKTDIVRFPYYVIPDIEALSKVRDPELLRTHRRRIAACIGDPDALRAILGDASEDFMDFYGALDLPTLSTSDTIDSFLQKFGSSVEDAHADVQPVVPVIPPVVDYADMLEREVPEIDSTSVPADATLGAIDAFLSQNPAPRVRPKKDLKEVEKPSLTESFAKILIKNGNYSRALEIITE
ncbi:MAG: hypothetical protein K2L11_01760, partial [Muribaculaceae bacterium]|nr:hypothetical protein [Muribaculaceae bacterium]